MVRVEVKVEVTVTLTFTVSVEVWGRDNRTHLVMSLGLIFPFLHSPFNIMKLLCSTLL